MTLQILSELCH